MILYYNKEMGTYSHFYNNVNCIFFFNVYCPPIKISIYFPKRSLVFSYAKIKYAESLKAYKLVEISVVVCFICKYEQIAAAAHEHTRMEKRHKLEYCRRNEQRKKER